MKKTKIDWADSTWNPVTGCLHDCEYCYARAIANRFGWGADEPDINERVLYEIPVSGGKKQPYPFNFQPTFHQYRLGEPAMWTKPRTIFVCSMADLFGDWVPDEWIEQVFEACKAAPQHRYLFLTKNPIRYVDLADAGKLPNGKNFWYGSTAANQGMDIFWANEYNTFVSIEPILGRFDCCGLNKNNTFTDWIIIGAETGNRKDRVIPEKAWIDELAGYGKQADVPVFMKESLRGLMGDDFRQEFPWEASGND